MSNNKFWNKDKNVKPISDDADLENTTKNSLNDLEIYAPELSKLDEAKEIKDAENVVFKMKEVDVLLEIARKQAVKDLLEYFREYKYNMLTEVTKGEAHKVFKWVEDTLKKEGKL